MDGESHRGKCNFCGTPVWQSDMDRQWRHVEVPWDCAENRPTVEIQPAPETVAPVRY